MSLEQDIEYEFDRKRAKAKFRNRNKGRPSRGIVDYLSTRHEVTIHPKEWLKRYSGFFDDRETAEEDLKAHEREIFAELQGKGYFEGSRVVRYFNEHFFNGPIRADKNIKGFTGHQYWHIQALPGQRFVRMETMSGLALGGVGSWWFRTNMAPRSELQANYDAAVVSEWNEFQILTVMTVPPGRTIDFYEGEIGPQTTFMSQKFHRFAGGRYMGGGGQLFLPQESRGRLVLDPRYYEYYLFDKRNPFGQLVKLRHTFHNGRTRVDLDQLKAESPRAYENFLKAAKLEGVKPW